MQSIPFVFAKIIGKEKPNANTLQQCYDRLQKTFGNHFVKKEEDIPFDCHIYLIAHGKNPLFNAVAGIDYSQKSSKDVVEEIKGLLTRSAQLKKEKFKGKIILEMCHSAEPMVNQSTRQKCQQIFNQDPDDCFALFLKLRKNGSFGLGSSSLLVEVHERMSKDTTISGIMWTSSNLAGYLGQSMDGNFTISGYAQSQTDHPLTVEYQKKRGFVGIQRKLGISYNENESYLQVNFSQKEPYGKV